MSQLEASYVAPDLPHLTKRTRVSFETDCPLCISALLQQYGYTPIAPKSPFEAARLVHQAAIAVIYQAGGVLCQGADPRPLIRLLDRAAQDSADAQPNEEPTQCRMF